MTGAYDKLVKRTNQVSSMLAIGSFAMALGRTAKNRYDREFCFTVTLAGGSPVFDLACLWLVESIPSGKQKALEAVYYEAGRRRGYGRLRTVYDGDERQAVLLDGHRISVELLRRGQTSGDTLTDLTSGRPQQIGVDRLVFTARTSTGRDAVLTLIKSLTETFNRQEHSPRLWIADRWGEWKSREDVPPRPIDTVYLADGQKERLVSDIQEFLNAEQRYASFGVPWHRGYLLHGVPGTGKTSIARALADHFGLDVYYLVLGDIQKDTALMDLVSAVKPRSILLIEDIDVASAASHNREEVDPDDAPITASSLLNVLDGVTTPNGVITIMTTNHPEVLDPALTRKGRVDVEEEIGLMSPEQASRMVSGMLGTTVKLPASTPPLRPSAVVGLIVSSYRESDDDIIKAVRRLK